MAQEEKLSMPNENGAHRFKTCAMGYPTISLIYLESDHICLFILEYNKRERARVGVVFCIYICNYIYIIEILVAV